MTEQKSDRQDDGLPRCDCGHLFEICNAPNCEYGHDADLFAAEFSPTLRNIEVRLAAPPKPAPDAMRIKPRRLLDDDEPNGYRESDDDWIANNREAVIQFLEAGSSAPVPQAYVATNLSGTDLLSMDRVREIDKALSPSGTVLPADGAAAKLADRAEGCLNSRNSAYPSDVLRECIAFLRTLPSATGATNPASDGPCFYCGEWTNGYAGDPGLWPLQFCQPDGTGVTRFHHTRCVSSRLATPPVRGDREAIARTNLIRDSIQRVYDEMCIQFSGVHSDDRTDSWLLNLHYSLKLLSLPVQPGAGERGSDAAEADRYFEMAGEFGHQLQEIAGVVQDAVDILAERKHGSAARSPGHNARVILETALKKVSPSALPSRQAPHSSRETGS
jgi:hypothetical protein